MGRTERANSENWGDKQRIDFFRCYNEAEDLYLEGWSLPEIAKHHNLLEMRVFQWCDKFQWERKREIMMSAPNGIGAMLREKLRKQVEAALGDDKLETENVEEISKMTKLINQMDGGKVEFQAAAIQAIQNFAVYLRKMCSDRDEYYLVSGWLQNYLRSVTEV